MSWLTTRLLSTRLLPAPLPSTRLVAALGLPLLLLAGACNDKGGPTPDDDTASSGDSGIVDNCAEDRDGDGYDNCEDCDDLEPLTYPGATERCDGEDNDCDDQIDEDNAAGTLWYEDADGDGFGGGTTTTQACNQPDGYVSESTDCDDGDSGVYPGAVELCDGLDQDCDGEVDEEAADRDTYYTDADADGYGDEDSATLACDAPEGTSRVPGDCDDADPAFNPSADESDCTDPTDYNCDGSVGYADADGDGFAACEECDDTDASHYPGAVETCDLADDDCDGDVDEDDAIDAGTWYADADDDRYGDPDVIAVSCEQPDGYIDNSLDCDDGADSVYPGADEVCNGVDDDCDDDVDNDAIDASPWYSDLDEDGFGNPDTEVYSCEQPDDTVADATDCDDDDPDIYPDAVETCNGFDDDCDGALDEPDALDASTWYLDGDGDGYGDADTTEIACDQPDGMADNADDCDDADDQVSPAADERCDEIDNDCDADIDEDSAIDAGEWYADADDDGFGDPATATLSCLVPAGYLADDSDCDDDDDAVFPGADERCNGHDDDCDGDTDEDDAIDASTWYQDLDGDRYGDALSTTAACALPTGYSADDTDCDDAEDAINPGADEICDSLDNNCDGETDEDTAVDASTWYRDTDRDGYGTDDKTKVACDRPGGYRPKGGDCDDTDGDINPSADEVCDGVDNDCDAVTDEDDAADAPTWYADTDEDGFGDAGNTTAACAAPSGYLADDTDCDDSDDLTFPGAPETCDGEDDDCDGSTDEDSAVDAPTWYKDADRDGHGDPSSTRAACSKPSGYDADDDDCDDTDSSIYPGATETCDGVDQDCDSVIDNDAVDLNTWYFDQDRDGYGDDGRDVMACDAPSSRYTATGGDCDDTTSSVNPAATEVCDNGVDEDCDGASGACALSGTAAYTTADILLIGEESSDKSGYAIAGGGDVNGDGLADLLVGAQGNDRRASSAGAAYVVLGAPSGTVDLSAADGILVGQAGSDSAGKAVSAGWDVDGDGYADVLIGAEGNDAGASSAGAAYLVKGPISGTASLSTADARLIGEDASDYAGAAVALMMDTDGDGNGDIAVGAKNHTVGTVKGGAVYVLPDPGSGDLDLSDATAMIYGGAAYDYASVPAGAGDVDGDGIGDVLVGAEGVDDEGSAAGAAYLFLGALTGGLSTATDADASLNGEERGDAAGVSVSGAGDTDGDGYDDLLIGAPKADYGAARDAGAAYVVLGPVSGILSLSSADAAIYGAVKSDGAGTSVSGAGDTDGDGRGDLLIGAPYADGGGADAGAAYLVLGPVAGELTVSSANATWDGGAASDGAGYAVSGAGDVDGDGKADLMIGVYGADAGGSGSGTTAIILGAGL